MDLSHILCSVPFNLLIFCVYIMVSNFLFYGFRDLLGGVLSLCVFPVLFLGCFYSPLVFSLGCLLKREKEVMELNEWGERIWEEMR